MHNDCTKLGLQRSLLRGLKLLIVRRFQLLIILFKSKMFIRALANAKRSCFVLCVETPMAFESLRLLISV